MSWHILSHDWPILIAELRAQGYLAENLIRGADPEVTVLEALQPIVVGPAFGKPPADASYRLSTNCDSFKLAKPSFLMPGNPDLFAFPSTLY